MAEFVHLHLHSDYSLLDGACDVDKLVARVAELKMPAVAVTDHGNMFAAAAFYNAAKAKGIRPIVGCELYICKKEDHDTERTPPEGDTYNHLLVLAENEEGYRNLVKITSEASLRGFYYKPRVSKKFLADHAAGLIGLSGCLKGEVCESLMEERYQQAYNAAGYYREIFGKENFFLEIQNQGLEAEHRIEPELLRLEKETGIPLVATNDSHYLCEEDAHAHDVLVCVQTGKTVQDTNRLKFQTNQFFVKSPEQMAEVFGDRADVLKRTVEIAERCNFKLEKIANPFPDFAVPPGFTVDSYFEHECRQGFALRRDSILEMERAGTLKHSMSEYDERLEREIRMIQQMRYSGYFLIVWDFVRYAKDRNIPVGPGRGSAAGSLVSYSLRITDIDPLQNNLYFERFLNPERVDFPDIDMDFCMNRRGEVIDYVTQKYGRANVAQIITFGTMAAKAAIKDVGRAMDVPYPDVDRIAKMVPTTLNITLKQALEDSPALQQAYENEPTVKEVIDTAMKLEGLVRNSGVHAAGVVISPRPLIELVPLHRTKNDEIVTAFDMNAISKMGLLKMDFLGLTTLTILDDAVKLIEQARGEPFDLKKIPLDDAKTYQEVFHKGLTSGVFQFESGGMRDVLRRYQPNTIDDLTALNALYRPGPMQMIDDFIERKWGRRKVEFELPEQEEILRETFGVMVYQEQVMRMAATLAGYSLGEADLLRRAMGKKIAEEMAKQRERFIQGGVQRGFPKAKIERIFGHMEEFAKYGFPKAHSAAYALLAYQTAYLKTHYPVEFMSALLTSITGDTDSVVKYIRECREMAISVEAPDINVSDANFTPHGNAIRFGLAAVKNVGRNAIESIVAARKKNGGFKTLFEFCEQVDLRLLNKRVIESLIKAGAMDSLVPVGEEKLNHKVHEGNHKGHEGSRGGQRARLMAAVDKAMERAQKSQREAEMGQHGLFGVFSQDDAPQPNNDKLPDVPDWDEHTRLQNEKEILGFFITGHPLEKYHDKLLDFGAKTTEEVLAMKQSTAKDETICIGGVISGVKVQKSKKGDLYARGKLEDMTGAVDVFVFPEAYKRLAEKVKLEVPMLAKAGVRIDEGGTSLAISELTPLEEARPKLPRSLRIRLLLDKTTEETVDALHSLCAERKGEAKVLLDVERSGDFMVVMEPERYTVTPDRAFITRVENLCGRGSVRVVD